MLSRTCLALYPYTVYGVPRTPQATRYARKPWSSAPECAGPVRQPPRNTPVLRPKYRPYSCTITSAATFDAPNTLWSDASTLIDSSIPCSANGCDGSISHRVSRSTSGSRFGVSPYTLLVLVKMNTASGQ